MLLEQELSFPTEEEDDDWIKLKYRCVRISAPSSQLPAFTLASYASRFDTTLCLPLNGDFEDHETHLDAVSTLQTNAGASSPERSGGKNNKNKNKSAIRRYVSGRRSDE